MGCLSPNSMLQMTLSNTPAYKNSGGSGEGDCSNQANVRDSAICLGLDMIPLEESLRARALIVAQEDKPQLPEAVQRPAWLWGNHFLTATQRQQLPLSEDY